MQFFASVFNTTIERNYALIRDIYSQLEPFKARRAGKLSGGMKQKLALCCALIHAPRVLLLDYMDEASQCDRISLMQGGRLLQTDTPDGICAAYTGRLFAVKSADIHRLLDDLKKCAGVKTAFAFGDNFHVTLDDDVASCTLWDYLNGLGHTDVEVKKIQPSVEDCFMSLMKL